MEPFTRVTAVGLPIDLPNVDTDRVIPARFLRKDRSVPEYARYLFHDVRFDADGAERPDFIMNRAPYRGARIVVAAENFGCGSSREAAVWVLAANGFRSVIAPSLGDIFHQNCFKNGVLPVILPADVVAGLRRQLHQRPGATLTVDLEAQTVTAPDGTPVNAIRGLLDAIECLLDPAHGLLGRREGFARDSVPDAGQAVDAAGQNATAVG